MVPGSDALVGVLELADRRAESCSDFDRQVLMTFCQHAAVALDRSQALEEIKDRHSVEASLEVARKIQQGFMPDKLPHLPGYEVATWWIPNEAVGGDYCDVILLNDNRLALAVADVSGHGLGPSLIMATVRAALQTLVLEHTAPEVLLNLLARSVVRDVEDGHFITMALAVLDPIDHSLQYANAGHAPAMYYESATGDFLSLESTGMPLGIMTRAEYIQGWPITLDVGDLIVLCTDGMVEATNARGEPFGIDRLKKLLRKYSSLSANQMVHHIGQAVQTHYRGDHPQDDLTILAVRQTR